MQDKENRSQDITSSITFFFKKQMFRIIVFMWLTCPFFLDFFSGTPITKMIPSHYNRDIWFAFLGSYLPATAFGLISLYNTIQIQRIQTKNRFSFFNNATLHRYDPVEKTIDDYSISNLSMRIEESIDGYHEYNYEDGFLLKFSIKDNSQQSSIEDISFENIEWKIADKIYDQRMIDVMRAWKEELFNDFAVFWLYKPETDFENIDLLMDNYIREDLKYQTSMLTLDFKITLVNKKSFRLKAGVELVYDKNPMILKAINYNCTAEEE